MGTLVGRLVGDADGSNVGPAVGFFEGCCVGDGVGKLKSTVSCRKNLFQK